MFRTKSLNCSQLSELINSHNQSKNRAHKKNEGSLRDLIAAKTVRYHNNLQKLALQDSNIPFEVRRHSRQTLSNYEQIAEIQEFSYDTATSVAVTEQHEQSNSSPLTCNHTQTVIDDLVSTEQHIKVPQQHECQQMNQLRQQCQAYSTQILQLEKEAKDREKQIEELHLCIQRLSLANQQLIENHQSKQDQFIDKKNRNQFQKCINLSINSVINSNKFATKSTNTDIILEQINKLQTNNLNLQTKVEQLQAEREQVLLYLYYSKNRKQEQQQIEESDCKKYLSLFELIKQNSIKNQQIFDNQMQLFKQVNLQVKKNQDIKIRHLNALLGSAQQEIRKLLQQLRDNQRMTINQHRNRTQQTIRDIMSRKKIQ